MHKVPSVLESGGKMYSQTSTITCFSDASVYKKLAVLLQINNKLFCVSLIFQKNPKEIWSKI